MSRSAYTPLTGGINLVTPPTQLDPGACLYAVNYECPVTGGYRRIEGYAAEGPEVPGEGPILGVASLSDRILAIREQAPRASAEEGGDPQRWAALFQLDDSAWRFLAEAHPGRHEWAEGNVTGTEGGRTLFGVGQGKPFGVQLPADEAGDYVSVVELSGALVGELPDGATYAASGDTITVTDTGSRDITGVTVIGRDGTTLLTVADVLGDGSTNTTLDIDLTGIAPNDVAYITLTIGSGNYPRRLSVPDLELNYTVLADAPSGACFIALFKNHLFLGFEPGSLQHSGIGDPENWDAATGGAGEIGVGQTLTGLLLGPGGVLHVVCRDSIQTLYGTNAEDWQLKTTVPNSGGRPYSAQSLMQPYFIAERGIASLEATNAYGDFRPMQPGHPVEPLFLQNQLFTRVVASAISKQRAQYRVWFDNGTGIYMSPAGITTVRFPHQVAVAYSGELDDGNEMLLFGSNAGMIYRLDNGATTFGGTDIEAFLTLAYNNLRSPSMRKRFRRVFWDVRSGSDANISILPDFDYGRTETGIPRREFIQFLLGGGLWDVATWNNLSWSVPSLGQEPMNVAGTGTAINFAIYSKSSSSPHEILGYDIHFDHRRPRRG
ncbi:hypothetical protein HPA02_27160 [Bisbaumannia pacifica]|uniref:Ubiquitin-activating enzyme E1 FCCH domain-containing protein n=1 Tax=Bisbaumannia pacifica TaxID=77098 RepID=A0A510XAP6_9GAMM|nr:hypothetical protein [Halomonas pacifica]GEK48433.1 hypothetical protein HPA02_27160 [Halomonas pacifica]